MTDLLRCQREGPVTTLALDDGKANVMSVAMQTAINDALDRIQADGTALLIVGRPGMFSGGFDLAVFKRSPLEQFAMLKGGAELAYRLLAFPAPVVVACTGHAIAMGVFVVMAGDVRLGIAGGPYKICLNEVQIGLTLPRFAIETCRQRLAPADFNRASITAEPYAPEQALTAGFLDVLVPADQLVAAAFERASALAKLPREHYVATKQRIRQEALTRMQTGMAADIGDWQRRLD